MHVQINSSDYFLYLNHINAIRGWGEASRVLATKNRTSFDARLLYID